MENAIRALYIGAGLIIGVMVLSVLLYVFRNGAKLGANYELSVETNQMTGFNGQFDRYAKVTNQLTSASDGYSFVEKGNTASDIITCANLAMSLNEQNDYDERNMLQVVVVTESETYYVHPIETQPKNRFIIDRELSIARTMPEFTDDNTLDFYKFLKKYNKVRIVDIQSDNYQSPSPETIYEYYFDVSEDEHGTANAGLSYSDITGRIDKIVFTINPTEHFDETTLWQAAR